MEKNHRFFLTDGYSMSSALPGVLLSTKKSINTVGHVSLKMSEYKIYSNYIDRIYLPSAVLWRYFCVSDCTDEFLLLELAMPLADVTVFSCLIPPTSWDL